MTGRILAAIATAALAGGAATSSSSAAAWPGCKAFTTQPQAQRAWEAAGRPSSADGDGDGKVCESLPATSGAKTTGCKRQRAAVRITFSRAKYPNIIRHIELSWQRGYPHVLRINRAGASHRRDLLLAHIPTKPGYDRDEAPAAALRDTVKADVMYVPSRENEAAGSSLGRQISRYCDGQRVVYRFT